MCSVVKISQLRFVFFYKKRPRDTRGITNKRMIPQRDVPVKRVDNCTQFKEYLPRTARACAIYCSYASPSCALYSSKAFSRGCPFGDIARSAHDLGLYIYMVEQEVHRLESRPSRLASTQSTVLFSGKSCGWRSLVIFV